MDTPLFSYDHALRLVKLLLDRYQAQASCDQTFGAWVLSTVYPNAAPETLVRCRDFRGAVRSSDGKSYYLGKLLSGCLPIAPLETFLAAETLPA